MFRLLFCSLFLAASIGVQASYTNDWIDYDKKYYKVYVAQEGIHRIPYATLSNLGLDTVPGTKFQMYHDGKEIPVYVGDNGGPVTGALSSGDFIAFYGQPNDGALDSNLYKDPSWHPHQFTSFFTDTGVYFLTWSTSSQQNKRFRVVNNDTSSAPPKEDFFYHQAVKVFKGSFNKPPTSNGGSTYISDYLNGEGEWGEKVQNGSKSVSLDTRYKYSSGQAILKTAVLGLNPDNHDITVRINGNTYGTANMTGKKLRRITNNNVNLTDISSSTSVNYTVTGKIGLTFCAVTYPREFNFGGQSTFRFDIQGAGTKYMTVSNYSDGGTTPILFDLTNQLRIKGEAGGPYNFILPDSTGATERKLFLTSQKGTDIITVNSLEPANFVDLSSLEGDYIIVTHPKLRGGGTDFVAAYKNYRASIKGGDYETQLINIGQLYDQFAYGIQKHPLSIRYFVDYALDSWSQKPKFLFLVGLGLTHRQLIRTNSNNNYYERCLIPTFGWPGSDNMLVAENDDYRPRIAVGRLAANTPGDVSIYYNKIKQLENHQNSNSQTREDKAWMKRVLHFGGGSNAGEQNTFKNYLNNYKSIVEGPLYGGDVTSFFKSSSDPIQIVASEYIDSLLKDGVSLMTFFGHSSPGSFDISLDNPENYNNYSKYPFILSNGCYAGNIFNTDESFLSKRFVFLENKGAIGFLAMSHLSYSSYDNRYSKNFYLNLSKDHYHEPVGKIVQHTVGDIYSNSNALVKMTAQQFTLHGDPAVRLNTHDAPDYYLQEQDQVSFEPTSLSVELDSFDMRLNIFNLGRAKDTTFVVRVQQDLPANNGTNIYTKTIQAPYYKDYVDFTLPMEDDMAGVNEFTIEVDWVSNTASGAVAELSEQNNTLILRNVKINANEAIPIYPYEFSIVHKQEVTLKASSVDLFAPIRDYIIQIDTTELFNSPVKREGTVRQKGGVIKWSPSLQYQDSTVYYWRITPDTLGNSLTSYNWNYSSFIYLKDGSPGWNQSHRFQYDKDSYANVYLPENTNAREFKFVEEIKDIHAKNFNAYHDNLHPNEIAWTMNLAKMHHTQLTNGGCCPGGGGVMIVVIDSATGLPWLSKPCTCTWGDNGKYNQKNCSSTAGDIPAFDFCDGQNGFIESWCNGMVDLLDTVRDGDYVLVMGIAVGTSSSKGHYVSDYPDYMKEPFRDLGFDLIDSVDNHQPFIFFGQKDVSGVVTQYNTNQSRATPTIQKVADSTWDVLNLNTTIQGKWSSGYITSPPIGPARNWKTLLWKYHTLESPAADEAYIEVIGIDKYGSETTLFSQVDQLNKSLSNIDADQYPYLKLRLHTRDDSLRTPVQLDYWRVLYDPLPEAALNPSAYYTFYDDTLFYGENGKFGMQVENVSDYHMDSLLTHYKIIQSDNQSVQIPFPRKDSLKAKEQRKTSLQFNSYKHGKPGGNTFLIDVNPDDDQPEQFHFNNIASIPFYILGDRENPLLDVTFDGRHILNGDIVSAQPHIVVRLKDENKYLAMNDTSLLKLWIQYPNESEPRRIRFANSKVQFIPANSQDLDEDNSARIEMDPVFKQDGDYELIVQGKDRSNNASGSLNYSVAFEVINKATITNVLNYPNPFTTSTRFVFTLTGSQPPTYFKIQIMTITGKIVRETTQEELNNIHVGRNITDFAWDGTDRYGDPLANGLYLYRVVATMNGEDIKHRETKADKYFESGFGKMYLMR